MPGWRQWLEQPQKTWLYNALFQIHFFVGAMAGVYLALMSVTGSIIVYRDELSRWPSIQWLVKLHTTLLAGRGWPPRERDRRSHFDVSVFDGSYPLVARNEALAPEPERKLRSAFPAHQLGPAQRARVLVLLVCSVMGCLRGLFRLSTLV